jgi:hypothetical protein
MKVSDLVKKAQAAMNLRGEKLSVDGEFGPKTAAAASKYDFKVEAEAKAVKVPDAGTPGSENPAYKEAKKYAGKKETDSKFGAWLSTFWKGVGLPHYKTIIGASFAWCGLFIFAMNTETGLKAISGAAGARNWAKYGVAIDWKESGIPQGAVLHINGNGNCGSGSGNHVTFADGSCTPDQLKKSGATVPGFGGNQANEVKRSLYPVRNLCAVRWPSEIPLPPPVSKGVDCGPGSASNESTK